MNASQEVNKSRNDLDKAREELDKSREELNSFKATQQVPSYFKGNSKEYFTFLIQQEEKREAAFISLSQLEFHKASSTKPSKTLGPVAKKPRITPKAVWKEEPKFIYSLEREKMFFVNRAHAVEQLQRIHQSKYYRALSGSGSEWIIPIADNVIGLGKSEFIQHYILKCKESWPNVNKRNEFQRTCAIAGQYRLSSTKALCLKAILTT